MRSFSYSAVLAGSLALASCTTGVPDSLSTTALDRAGGPPGSGPYCAYYWGQRTAGPAASVRQTYRRRACFSSLRQCRNWLFAVQTRFPVSNLRKGCR